MPRYAVRTGRESVSQFSPAEEGYLNVDTSLVRLPEAVLEGGRFEM